ncbi:LysR family transcriptional regulator [Roseomonas sp. NAR14]|uniref:LysR family transcriptional regulator n=1 Tax=Roseomonas acroporae TaxID=2937791 RepID=A0A9X1Y8Y2_9PROT|nr:LysR family transcriptional regulator [Roseomonas acroporae]MCK8785703.1 LysR family transcriptional regulator [Roseomonas acroporae]
MLEWDDLRHFLAIARHGSLSAAARALGVAQPTMGRRLAALEQRAGARLLERTPGGYTLTPAGEAALGHAERIENEVLAVERGIGGRDVRLEGRIRLTAVETLVVDILLPELADFAARYPGITLELITDTRPLSLARREADVALRMARPDQGDLVARQVSRIDHGLYASRDYLDRHGTPDLAAGAPGHRVVLALEDLMRLQEMAWLAGMTGRAQVALRSNSRFAQRQAACGGMGLACLARYLGDAAPALVRLETPVPPPRREVWLVVHRDTRHTPRIRSLTDFLGTAFQRRVAVLAPEG